MFDDRDEERDAFDIGFAIGTIVDAHEARCETRRAEEEALSKYHEYQLHDPEETRRLHEESFAIGKGSNNSSSNPKIGEEYSLIGTVCSFIITILILSGLFLGLLVYIAEYW